MCEWWRTGRWRCSSGEKSCRWARSPIRERTSNPPYLWRSLTGESRCCATKTVVGTSYVSCMQTWNDEQLRAAVSECRNTSQVLRRLQLRPVGGNYETIRRRIEVLGLDTSHWYRRRRHHATLEELSAAAARSDSVMSALRVLGWPYN